MSTLTAAEFKREWSQRIFADIDKTISKQDVPNQAILLN